MKRVGETDYQRLKWFADDLDVIDLMGLNDRRIAHAPRADAVLWGKGGMKQASSVDADVLFLGARFVSHTPMGKVPVAQIADDPRLGVFFLGDPVEPSIRDYLVSDYVPVSLSGCGWYTNFFVRNDRAAALGLRSGEAPATDR